MPFFSILPLVFLLFSCSQSPIFFDISNEVAPKEPRIKGAPSAIVEFKGALFVASKDLYTYESSNRAWTLKETKPLEGNIHDLAATNDHLYALTMHDAIASSAELWRTSDPAGTWERVGKTDTQYPVLQGLYAAGDTLFVGARHISFDSHVIFYVKNQGNSATLEYTKNTDGRTLEFGSGGRLIGAAWDGANYFVATTDSGIYAGNSPDTVLSGFISGSQSTTAYLTGMIHIQGTIAAVTSNEEILYKTADAASFTLFGTYPNIRFTGALSLYEKDGLHLLLLGIEVINNTYTFGYREMLLGPGGTLSSATPLLQVPGESASSSVANDSQYKSSLGRHVAVSLKQTPAAIDPDRILFASTQKDGVWAYRNQVWNAEE